MSIVVEELWRSYRGDTKKEYRDKEVGKRKIWKGHKVRVIRRLPVHIFSVKVAASGPLKRT